MKYKILDITAYVEYFYAGNGTWVYRVRKWKNYVFKTIYYGESESEEQALENGILAYEEKWERRSITIDMELVSP